MDGLSTLTKEWQQWVNKSIARGVNIREIASELFSRGWDVAGDAILALHGGNAPRPKIDTANNTIVLSDKTISISQVCHNPQIVVMDDFLSPDEITTLIELSSHQFTASLVVDNNNGGSVSSNARTSDSVGHTRSSSTIVKTIETRVSELLNWPVANGEGVLVLRYEKGQEYKPHHDYFDGSTDGGLLLMERGGQRVGTFLMFLSDVDAGGGTCFPTIGFEVRPKAGRAIYFANLDAFGRVDNKTLHGGMPVIEGTKYLATIWLRERPYC